MKRISISKGFSLIEVLIAFVILVIGVLGASILVIRSSQINMAAYETEQAVLIAHSIVETIRSDSINSDKYEQLSAADIDCSNKMCSADDKVKFELYELNQRLISTKLPNASFKIKFISEKEKSKTYLLTIEWGSADEAKKSKYTVDFVAIQ